MGEYDFFKDYDVLILGGLIPREYEDEVFKKSIYGIPISASAHLQKLIGGFDALLPKPVRLLNILPVGSYPKRYKSLFVPGFSFSHTEGARDINIGYCNLTVWKKLSKKLAIRKNVKRWIKTEPKRPKVLIIYEVEGEYLSAAVMLKKLCPKIHISLIVPDLPAFTDIDKGGRWIYKLRAIYRTHSSLKRMKAIDSFVFLTWYMKDYYKAKKPYVVVEGVTDSESEQEVPKTLDDGLKTIVYTGTFTEKYGIMDLVHAFMLIPDPDFRLVLCGGGETEEKVKKCAKKDSRIIYKGVLKHKEALGLQRGATILVNPRQGGNEFTKYSFPSKIMEYMSAGRPVLCFPLEGIPKEYDDYLFYFKSPDHKSMAEDMRALCGKAPEVLNEIGEKGKKFVVENKNNKVQCAKILDMIKKSMEDSV